VVVAVVVVVALQEGLDRQAIAQLEVVVVAVE
jgi:hypothetical protein